MMNIGMYDLNKNDRTILERILIDMKTDDKIYNYKNYNDLVKSLERLDLIILEMTLWDCDGISLARKIKEKYKDLDIIFISDNLSRVDEAFEVKAYTFLQRPFKEEKMANILCKLHKEKERKYFVIENKKEIIKVSEHDIIFLEGYGDGTYIHMKNGVIESKHSLVWWKERLNQVEYFSPYRGYLIALKYVLIIKENSVIMEYCSEEVPVAKRKRKKVKEIFVRYMKMQHVR